jgi:hypothetical protein
VPDSARGRCSSQIARVDRERVATTRARKTAPFVVAQSRSARCRRR